LKDKKLNHLKFYSPPVLWMAFIFFMSTDTFSFSKTSSIIIPVLEYIFPFFSADTVEGLHHALRKAGHFTEYAILSLLWFRAVNKGFARWNFYHAFLSFTITSIYAFTDEYHQSFIEDRSSSILDVLLDSSGALTSQLALWLHHLRSKVI